MVFWNGILLITSLSAWLGLGNTEDSYIRYKGNSESNYHFLQLYNEAEPTLQYFVDGDNNGVESTTGSFNYVYPFNAFMSQGTSSNAYNNLYSVNGYVPLSNYNNCRLEGELYFDYRSTIVPSTYSSRIWNFVFEYNQATKKCTYSIYFGDDGFDDNELLHNVEYTFNFLICPNVNSTFHVGDPMNEFNVTPFMFSRCYNFCYEQYGESYNLDITNLSTNTGDSYFVVYFNLTARLVDIVNETRIIQTNSYNEGYEVGEIDGNDIGYESGVEDGFENGKIAGAEIGYTQGYNDGYAIGRIDGYDLAESNDNDFFKLLGAVIDTPIVALRRLFSYEVFGVNLFQALMTIVSLIVALAIFKLIIRI